MYAGRPIIGIVGGIGSGKSHVAGLFGEVGCLVIDSDAAVGEAYGQENVKKTLREWWGEEVFDREGEVDRQAIGKRVFGDEGELRRLERVVHPVVARVREEAMARGAGDAQVVAFVWDTPLLVEAGLAGECDAVVIVECDAAERRRRVVEGRGWTGEEWSKREKSQLGLDKKREIARYSVRNTAEADDEVRSQVREVLSRILAEALRVAIRDP